MNIYSESIQRILTTDTIICYFEDGKMKSQTLNRYVAAQMQANWGASECFLQSFQTLSNFFSHPSNLIPPGAIRK